MGNNKANLPIVVTGAASGIGAAVVRNLARNGKYILALDIAPFQYSATLGVENLSNIKHERVDLRDTKEVYGIINKYMIDFDFPSIGGIACCAGIVDRTPFQSLDDSRFMEVYSSNCLSAFGTVRACANMLNDGGRICLVSSAAGLRGGGIAGTMAYAASKAAVIGLTKSMAREFSSRNILVNCVAPAVIDTPMLSRSVDTEEMKRSIEEMTLLGRSGTADEVSEAIIWLLSPEMSFMTGATLPVDGGLTL